MDRTNIVTPTVTAVPRNEHWMKIFFRLQVHLTAVGPSDFRQNFRFTAPWFFSTWEQASKEKPGVKIVATVSVQSCL